MSEFYQSLSFQMGLQVPRNIRAQGSCDIVLHLANSLKILEFENEISSLRARWSAR
jgi:hypothetical protein